MTYYLELMTGDGHPINLSVQVPDDRIALRFAMIYMEGFRAAGAGPIDLMRLSRKPTRGVEYKDI